MSWCSVGVGPTSSDQGLRSREEAGSGPSHRETGGRGWSGGTTSRGCRHLWKPGGRRVFPGTLQKGSALLAPRSQIFGLQNRVSGCKPPSLWCFVPGDPGHRHSRGAARHRQEGVALRWKELPEPRPGGRMQGLQGAGCAGAAGGGPGAAGAAPRAGEANRGPQGACREVWSVSDQLWRHPG